LCGARNLGGAKKVGLKGYSTAAKVTIDSVAARGNGLAGRKVRGPSFNNGIAG